MSGGALRDPAECLAELLATALRTLAVRRPVFHSEADFQLALAWGIQTQHPDATIRLELRVLDRPRINLDVLVVIDGLRFALELKYLRAPLETTIDGETFVLVAGAPDLDRYDTIKDVVRLDQLLAAGLVDAGAAVVLSDPPTFWQPTTTGRATGYDEFRIHEGSTLAGTMDWGPSAGPGTRRGRECPHSLTHTYRPSWQPYSRVAASRNREFRSLVVISPPRQDESRASLRQAEG